MISILRAWVGVSGPPDQRIRVVGAALRQESEPSVSRPVILDNTSLGNHCLIDWSRWPEDYQGPAPYYPRQQVIDKRQWKDDPFSEWRRDLNRAEQKAPVEDLGDGWKSDPFHWMRRPSQDEVDGNIEVLQEAQVARHLMSLPSFSEAPVRRFNENQQYVEPKASPRGYGPPAVRDGGPERWKDDAFFGWLPGRGPEEETRLRRPLQQARLARLPSFAEGSKELNGVTGRGIGVLTIWVNAAANLAYSPGSGLHGTPSPAVKLRVRGDRPNQEKITTTVARDSNPRWNAPPMTFEVNSLTDVLQLDVLDWANPRGEQHLNQHFLGRSQIHVQRIIELLHRSKNPTKPRRAQCASKNM